MNDSKIIRKCKFTIEEDQQILELVNQMKQDGSKKFCWHTIAKHFPLRTNRQIRERYLNFLDPCLNKTELSPQEFDLLQNEVKKYLDIKHGVIPWSKISKLFPGRTDIFLKNKFDSIKRKMKKMNKPENESTLSSNSTPVHPLQSTSQTNNNLYSPPLLIFLPPKQVTAPSGRVNHSHPPKNRNKRPTPTFNIFPPFSLAFDLSSDADEVFDSQLRMIGFRNMAMN